MIRKGKIYHIVEPGVWERALMEGRYFPASLKSEGFVHCSTLDQLFESAAIYFEGHDRLVVLEILVKRVLQNLKWEPGRREELFPHIYGPIRFEAVENSRVIERQPDGTFDWES